MNNLGLHLLRLRVRWYFHALRKFEIKFRQAIILIFGLGPGILLVFAVLYMTQAVLGPGLQLMNNFLMLCLLEAIFLLWVMCCSDSVKGEPLDRYVKSLPLSKSQRYSVDLGVLLIANFIGWMLLIGGVAYMIYDQEISALGMAVVFMRVSIVIALVLTVQMLWFRGSRVFLGAILIINLLFVGSKSLDSHFLLLSSIMVLGMVVLLNLFNIGYSRDNLSLQD